MPSMPDVMTFRDRVKAALRATGADRVVSHARYAGRLLVNPVFRDAERRARADFREWRRHRVILEPPLRSPLPRTALIVTKGTVVGAKIELAFIKALELAGFASVVLCDRELGKFYRLAGVRGVVHWEQFTRELDGRDAGGLAHSAAGIADILPFEVAGARVGKFALSSAFRSLKVGRLDFSLPATRAVLGDHLRGGGGRAHAAHRLLDAVRPDLALFMGNRYSGQGELMDVCLSRGVDVLTWFDAHRSSALMLKRYRIENRDRHHGSISDDTWAALCAMPWGAENRDALRREYAVNYAAGDWYSRGGTQVNKRVIDPASVRARLGLDPERKTAVIFPHILWDATLFWGEDLFSNYEDWLVETVKAAAANTRLNWIIKIHPAHVAKSAMERDDRQPAEMAAITRRIGALPRHVTLIPPDTDINTYSLFGIMDYCLTVRGTIGIEAASLGIRVLTAGTGRYDHRGFTTDSASASEYLDRLARLESLPPLSEAERELAERFAYGAFLLRPFPLSTWTIDHAKDVEATTHVSLNATTVDALRRAPDLLAFAAWAQDGHQEDFLWRAPAAARDEVVA